MSVNGHVGPMSRHVVKPAMSVSRAFFAPLTWRRPQQLVLPVDAGAREVRVQIDEPRKQRGAAQVDDPCRRRHRQVAANRLDTIAAHDDHRPRQRRAAAAVDDPGGADRDNRRRCLGAKDHGDRERHDSNGADRAPTASGQKIVHGE